MLSTNLCMVVWPLYHKITQTLENTDEFLLWNSEPVGGKECVNISLVRQGVNIEVSACQQFLQHRKLTD